MNRLVGWLILWMDEILHHPRDPGMIIPLQIPANNGFPWYQSGAGFCPSTVGSTLGQVEQFRIPYGVSQSRSRIPFLVFKGKRKGNNIFRTFPTCRARSASRRNAHSTLVYNLHKDGQEQSTNHIAWLGRRKVNHERLALC